MKHLRAIRRWFLLRQLRILVAEENHSRCELAYHSELLARLRSRQASVRSQLIALDIRAMLSKP